MIVSVEIDKRRDGTWATYNARTVAGKGSNAKRHARDTARELARATMGRMGVRVVASIPGEYEEVVWDAAWGRER